MKKEMIEYLNGDRNAVRDEFILSRERSGSSELVRVSIPEVDEPLYSLWKSAKKRRKLRIPVEEEPDIIEQAQVKEQAAEQPQPKHTGGKKPYVMLMEGKSEEIRGLSLEASGLLLKLFYGGCIEWHTGRIISKLDKRPLALSAMAKRFKVGKNRLRQIMAELSAVGMVRYDPKKHAYFADRSIARKGRSL